MSRNFALALVVACACLTVGQAPARAGEVVWWTPNWGQARAEKLAADFEKANPGTTVKLEVTTSNGLPQRVLTALQSGTVPDIIEVQHPWVNGYAQAGLVQPVDDVIAAGDRADFNPAALSYDTFEGKLYGIPYRIETAAVLVNADMFAAAGLDVARPPQTWPDLVQAAQKLTANGVFGFGITGGGEVGNTITRLLPMIWANGGDVISADGKKAIANSAETVAAVRFYTDFYRNKQSPASTLQNDGLALRQLFVTKRLAMYPSGQYDLPPIAQADPSIKVSAFIIPHPPGKQSASIINGWSFVVPKDARNPADAKAFLRFLSTTENEGYFTDTFPARQSSLALPRFQVPALKPFADALAFGRPAPNNPHWVQISQALFDGVQRILIGQDPQKAMDQANDEIQALLDS